jgi:hypothetical protein
MKGDALTALFDLDGTLIDSIELIWSSYRHTALVHTARAPDDEFWLAGLGRPLPWQFSQLTDDPAEVQRMIATYRAHNQAHHDSMVKRYPGALEAVRALKARGTDGKAYDFIQNQVVAARAKPSARNATDPIAPVADRLQLRPKGRGAGESMGLPRELDATSSVLVINAPFSDVTGGVSKLRSRVLGEWPTRRNVAAGRSRPRVAHAPMRQTPRWRGLLLTLRPRRPPQRAAPISRMPRSVKPTLPIPISAMLCSVMPILQAQISPRPI